MIYYWDKKLHVSWYEFIFDVDSVWVQLKILIKEGFFATINMKDQVLGNVFGGDFSNFFRENISPHTHYQDMLQSTSSQIWDSLPSCWGCFLTLWVEICVPYVKFVFSGDNWQSQTSWEILLAQFLMISFPVQGIVIDDW